MRLPRELVEEVLLWLPADLDLAAARLTCRRFDSVLRGHIVVLCAHRYRQAGLSCTLVCAYRKERVWAVAERALAKLRPTADGDAPSPPACVCETAPGGGGQTRAAGAEDDGVLHGVLLFPHCDSLLYPPCDGFSGPVSPDPSAIDSHVPQHVSPDATVGQLRAHRLLLTDSKETWIAVLESVRAREEPEEPAASESAPEPAAKALATYVRLLLRYQVKHQEYNYERRSRARLLRTYIRNLEERLCAKLQLAEEFVELLWLRHSIRVLPTLAQKLEVAGGSAESDALVHLRQHRALESRVARLRGTIGEAKTTRFRTQSFNFQQLDTLCQVLSVQDKKLDCCVWSVRSAPERDEGVEAPLELRQLLDVVPDVIQALASAGPLLAECVG